MIGFIAAVVLCQFKVGDEVYVKAENARAYKTQYMAAQRYNPPVASYSAGARPEEIPESVVTSFSRGEKFEVASIDTVDDEQFVKVVSSQRAWWIVSKDVAILDESAKAIVGGEAIAKKLKPYCVTKSDHAALAAATQKGLDPLSMTAEQAQSLTPGQRRALSGVKARYLKNKKP